MCLQNIQIKLLSILSTDEIVYSQYSKQFTDKSGLSSSDSIGPNIANSSVFNNDILQHSK